MRSRRRWRRLSLMALGQVQNHTHHGRVVWCRRFGTVYAMGIRFDTPLPP